MSIVGSVGRDLNQRVSLVLRCAGCVTPGWEAPLSRSRHPKGSGAAATHRRASLCYCRKLSSAWRLWMVEVFGDPSFGAGRVSFRSQARLAVGVQNHAPGRTWCMEEARDSTPGHITEE